ncbi:hypothetical protein RQP46_005066 [Phenoliferia psychrophenolica]
MESPPKNESGDEASQVSLKKEEFEHIESVPDDGGEAGQQQGSLVARNLAIASLTVLFIGSQEPLYFVAQSFSYIIADLVSADRSSWVPVAYSLTLAATCTFNGALSDLLGRRNLALFGAVLCCIGCAVVATARTLDPAIIGMAILGCGAGITELSAVAGVAELAPVSKRSLYVGLLTASFVPFTAFILNALGLVGLFFFYRPPPLKNTQGLTKWETIKGIDIVGTLLLIGGIAMFLAALQLGGYSDPWSSAKVLSLLIIGLLLVACYPLPLIAETVFHPTPVKTGLRGFGFQACCAKLFRPFLRWQMIIACVVMSEQADTSRRSLR